MKTTGLDEEGYGMVLLTKEGVEIVLQLPPLKLRQAILSALMLDVPHFLKKNIFTECIRDLELNLVK